MEIRGRLRLKRAHAHKTLTALPWLLVLAAAPAFPASAVLDRAWREHVSDHFRLLTDVRPKMAAERIRELEMFRSVVLGVTGQSAVAQGDKIDVVLFARHRDFNALFGHGRLGFFMPGLRSSRMVSGAGTRGAGQRQILFHEYVHYLLCSASSVPYPAWYNEGLAEMLSTVQERNGRIIVGSVPARARYQRLTRLPISTLLFSSYGSMPPGVVNDFYAGAWELVHYLHAGHLTGARERFGQMQNYLAALQRGADGEAAFGQAFDISPLELQREVEWYVERGRIPRLEYSAQAFEWREDAQVNTPPRAEVAYELGYLAVLVNPDIARALFEEVLPSLSADSPLRARSLAGIAVTHQFQGNFRPGYEIGRQAVAKARDDDALARLELADLITAWCSSDSPPPDCEDLFTEARELYGVGLALDRGNAELQLGLARLELEVGGNVAAAFDVLSALADVYPWHPGLQLEAGRGAIASRQPELAEPFLLRALNLSHNEKFRARIHALQEEATTAE